MLRRMTAGLMGLALLAGGAAAATYKVRAKGRVLYPDKGGAGGTYLPLVGAKIHVMDSDWDFDDTIAEGSTDANGNFDLAGTADDNSLFSSGKPDPYVEVELESGGGHLVVESEILAINVTADTAEHTDTAGTINFGTFHFASEDGKDAEALYAANQRQYEKFKELTGSDTIPAHDGISAILFPAFFAAGVPWTTEESIHWPGGYRGDAGGFNVVYHEFGHRIREAADGDFTHFLADVVSYDYMQHHSKDSVTNPGFAFNEGWAEYHRTLLDAAEKKSIGAWPIDKHDGGSNKVEGNVAARLLQLSDQCGGFAKLWAVLLGAGHGAIHSYSEFAAKFKAKVPSCKAAALGPAAAGSAGTRLAGAEPGLVGALAPGGITISLPQQLLAVTNLGVEAKARLATVPRKLAPVFAGSGKTKDLLARFWKLKNAKYDDWMKSSTTAYQQHLAGLKPNDGTKQWQQQSDAYRMQFLTQVLQARIAYIGDLMKALDAEAAPLQADKGATATIAALRTKYQAKKAELASAITTGKVRPHDLPRNFLHGSSK